MRLKDNPSIIKEGQIARQSYQCKPADCIHSRNTRQDLLCMQTYSLRIASSCNTYVPVTYASDGDLEMNTRQDISISPSIATRNHAQQGRSTCLHPQSAHHPPSQWITYYESHDCLLLQVHRKGFLNGERRTEPSRKQQKRSTPSTSCTFTRDRQIARDI